MHNKNCEIEIDSNIECVEETESWSLQIEYDSTVET